MSNFAESQMIHGTSHLSSSAGHPRDPCIYTHTHTPSAIQSPGLPQGQLGLGQLTLGANHYAGT